MEINQDQNSISAGSSPHRGEMFIASRYYKHFAPIVKFRGNIQSVLARRNPRKAARRLPGKSALRLDDRKMAALSFQSPPRTTRYGPRLGLSTHAPPSLGAFT